jgi:hypothetical protein
MLRALAGVAREPFSLSFLAIVMMLGHSPRQDFGSTFAGLGFCGVLYVQRCFTAETAHER